MKNTGYRNRLKSRMMTVGGGIFFLLLGLFLQHEGRLAWINYYGQNVFSVGIIAFGGIIAGLGLLPNSWVAKLASVQKRRPVTFHHNSTNHPGKD